MVPRAFEKSICLVFVVVVVVVVVFVSPRKEEEAKRNIIFQCSFLSVFFFFCALFVSFQSCLSKKIIKTMIKKEKNRQTDARQKEEREKETTT